MKRGETPKPSSDGAAFDLSLDRRDFLKVAGGGIIIFFSADLLLAQDRTQRPGAPGQSIPTDFNAFLQIKEDGRVSCFTGKIEMGQGVVTSLAQMLADELDVSFDQVEMVMGDTDLCPWDRGTFGSLTTRFFGPPLRTAAAEARSVLLNLAAERLKVPEDRLTVKNGVVSDRRDSKNRVAYSELARGKAIEKHLTATPSLKKPSEYQIMGKSFHRADGLQKVTGKALYAGDIRLPGMLYAKLLRPPAHGAKLKQVDTAAVRNDPGMIVVEEPGLIAVLHPYPDQAEKAVARIKAEWEIPKDGPDNTTIHRHLLDAVPETGSVVSEGGNPEQGEKLASRIFEETYLDHYVAHAAMETHTATATFDGNRATVWPATQTPFPVKDSVARALGIPAGKVRVIMPFVGGGFGGKSFHLQAIEAARLAKLTGKPVQVMWSRKEEFFFDTFRPASIVKIKSGIDPSGKILSWRYDVYYAGSRGAEQIYAVPHHRETSFVHYNGMDGTHPFATGPWRAPGNSSNTFARESQIDTMAAKHGMDPVAFRLKNLSDKRMIATLQAAAEKFRWKAAPAPSGGGCGVACLADAGACVAAMAEVEVDRSTGKVAVKRVVCAADLGFVINPEGAMQQIEGGLIMGLGYSLTEEIDFRGGRILNTNFDTYKIPRFSWLPRIEAVLVDNPGHPPQGCGEPAIPSMGAAIANAIFDATGARLRTTPMTPARVKEAIARATPGK